jgi:hypothetical protein
MAGEGVPDGVGARSRGPDGGGSQLSASMSDLAGVGGTKANVETRGSSELLAGIMNKGNTAMHAQIGLFIWTWILIAPAIGLLVVSNLRGGSSNYQ